jgi:hypothetical protein
MVCYQAQRPMLLPHHCSSGSCVCYCARLGSAGLVRPRSRLEPEERSVAGTYIAPSCTTHKSLTAAYVQARVDRFSLVGAALGGSALAFSSVARNGPLMHRTMGGACLGLATGVFAHLITSSFHERFT